MSNSLAGYAAFITGGSSGLGLSHARVLAARGAKVAVTDFKQENLDRAQAEFTREGIDVLCLKADNRVVAEVKAAVAAAEAAVRPARYPRQQRRHQRHARAHRGDRRGVLRQHVRHARQGRVLRRAGGRAGDEGAQVRPHHQHRLGLRHDRLARHEPLHHVQGRAHRAHALLGARAHAVRHHGQHRVAGPGRDADDARRPDARA